LESVDEEMKKLVLRKVLAGYISLAFLLLILSSPTSGALSNADTMLPPTNIERKVAIIDGGYVMINDTFTISIDLENNTSLPSSYIVGIPKNYSKNLVYYSAYDSKGNLLVEPAEKDEAFMWLKIFFPKEVEVGGNKTYSFTLMMIFSNLVSKEAEKTFRAFFPLYPALVKGANFCNVTVIFPSTAKVSQNNFPGDVFLNKTSDFRVLYNLTSPLTAYANISSWVEFWDPSFKIMRILEIRRKITVDGWGKISVTDIYDMEIVDINSINVILPPNSTDISAYDAYGRYAKGYISIKESGEYGENVKIFLSDKLPKSGRVRIAVVYTLPFWKYVGKSGWQNYELNINITKPDEFFINKISVIILLPEGAHILRESSSNDLLKYERVSYFQERIIAEYYNVTKYENLKPLSIKYQYIIFWAAFRPTMAIIGLISLAYLFLVFLKPLGKAEIAEDIPSETLRRFIEVCEERIRIISEIESLKEQSIKGKMSRRRYRLLRRTLDEQLSSAQKRLMDLKAIIESAGGRYAEMVRRMEEANADIESAKKGIEEVEIRYRRGEISAEVRRKLIEEYSRRREKAERTVEEILLRLKEETM